MNAQLQFTGTPRQLREMYEHGWGIAEIMERTGKEYIEVRSRLLEAGTVLITGGPHDTDDCDHQHWLTEAHENGAPCCEANPRLRPNRGRRF